MTELQVLKDNIRVLLKLELGTDIEIEEDYDLLMFLCRNDRKEVVKDLVKNGFDLDVRNHNDSTLLTKASYFGDLDIVKILLDIGAKINVNDYFGSALFWSCYNRHINTVKILLENGADPNIKDVNNYTILHWTQKDIYKYSKVVKLLKKYGAKE